MEGHFTITQKYTRHINMANPPPCVWLCNEYPDFKEQLAYWDVNSVRVELQHPLF